MDFFNKIEDETKNLFSNIDDGVNDTIGWEGVAALVAMMMGMPTGTFGGSSAGAAGAAGGSTGFSFLPSGEMTVFSPETVGATSGATGGGSNFLSSLFGGSQELAPMGNDYSRMVEMYPTSSGNIFEPAGMSPSQISSIQGLGDMSLLQERMAGQSMPSFGNSTQQQAAQQLAQLNESNQDNQIGGIKKGQAIPQAILSSLLDPSVALKAYRPTLI
jgi:hypothetical protein